MAAKKITLDLGDDGDLSINTDYAQNYERWRRKEELQKLKDKYGDNADSYDSDESKSSEEAFTWTAENERGFLRTLGALKSKMPQIYDEEVRFFETQNSAVVESKSANNSGSLKSKDKKMTLRDYEQRLVTKRDGRFSEDEDDERAPPLADSSYGETQARLKRELKSVLDDHESGNEDDQLLQKRVKSSGELKAEEDDYLDWLKGREDEAAEADEFMRGLKKSWTANNLNERDKFLRDYILNKRHVTDATTASADSSGQMPTYDEIVEFDDEEEKREQFEVKYNFRFEEPDQNFLKQYPRTIKDSLRKPDNSRKEARERRDQRKDEEKRQRKEDMRQMKTMKRQEMEEKMARLRDEAGDERLPAFDASEKTLDEYLDDALGYDEITADNVKTKFRYRQVEPSSFGLTTDEILAQDDAQLNAWVSVKKATAFKTPDEERREQQFYERKAQLPGKKAKTFASIMPKETRQKPAPSANANETSNKPKKRRRAGKAALNLDTYRLKAYGVSTQKLKSALHKKKTQQQ